MNETNRASLTNEYGDELLLIGWSLDGDLRGMGFECTLAQSFVNSTGDHAEIIYNFPLPWGAELLSLEAQVADKHYTGAVIGKKESEAKYEKALSEGDSAILLERNAANDYTLNLGGIKHNEKIVITVRYGQMLRFSKSGLRLAIPTVIAPRYGDPMKDGGLKQHQVSDSSLLAEYPFNLEIALHGEWADAGIESPSHSIKVGQVEQGVRKISLSKESFLDRDFVLSLDRSSQASVAMVVSDYADRNSAMILAAFRPDLAGEQLKSVNVKILVDCSGSMQGDSIEAARKSLQEFVQDLSAVDHFSLSKFGSSFMHRSKGLWTATEPAKLAARRWINSLEADMGGTEMGAALLDIFELSSSEPADVLLVTDGEINAIDHVIELAKESKHRLFIVGIGIAPAESHLRRLAEETSGACDFVAPGEDVAPAMINMFARLRTSALRELRVTWPDSAMTSWVSPMERAAYDGDTVYAYARFSGKASGLVSLLGRKDDGSEVIVGSVELPKGIVQEPDLSRLAISGYVNQLIRDNGKEAREGQQLAESYQLVTNKTNLFMLVDRGDEKSESMPELYKVDQMVPAGYGGLGSVKRAQIRYCSSSSGSSFDFSQYDMPPGLRSSRGTISSVACSLKVRPFDNTNVDHFDIPAFLRREIDADMSKVKPPETWELDVCDIRLFQETIDFVGLTPLGVCEWVKHTIFTDWPTSYAGLIKIGVPEAIVDWLELLVAMEAGADEATAVASFLYAITTPPLDGVLAKSISDFGKGRKGVDQFAVAHNINQIPLDAMVYADVFKALGQSVEGSWPNCMFDMQLA